MGEKHPGLCVKESSFPWEGEGDPLGRELHAINGQRVKFLTNQTVALRRFGLSEDQIKAEFRTFLDESTYERKRWKYAYYDFLKYLRMLAASHPKNPSTSNAVNAERGSSRAVHNARCTKNAPRTVHEPSTTVVRQRAPRRGCKYFDMKCPTTAHEQGSGRYSLYAFAGAVT